MHYDTLCVRCGGELDVDAKTHLYACARCTAALAVRPAVADLCAEDRLQELFWLWNPATVPPRALSARTRALLECDLGHAEFRVNMPRLARELHPELEALVMAHLTALGFARRSPGMDRQAPWDAHTLAVGFTAAAEALASLPPAQDPTLLAWQRQALQRMLGKARDLYWAATEQGGAPSARDLAVREKFSKLNARTAEPKALLRTARTTLAKAAPQLRLAEADPGIVQRAASV